MNAAESAVRHDGDNIAFSQDGNDVRDNFVGAR